MEKKLNLIILGSYPQKTIKDAFVESIREHLIGKEISESFEMGVRIMKVTDIWYDGRYQWQIKGILTKKISNEEDKFTYYFGFPDIISIVDMGRCSKEYFVGTDYTTPIRSYQDMKKICYYQIVNNKE